MSYRFQIHTGTIAAAALAACLVAGCASTRHEERSVTKLPETVENALNTKFPGARVVKATHETEDGVEAYDVEFNHSGRHCEADIAASGAILNWEEAVATKDLPNAVNAAVLKRYPNSTTTEAMRITGVKGNAETLEGYEIVLTTADKRSVEVMVAPGGEILEDSGVEK